MTIWTKNDNVGIENIVIFGLANFDNLTLSKMDPDCQKRAELSKMSKLSKPEISRSGRQIAWLVIQ